MRVDVLLHRCRFAKTRGIAQQIVASGHLRCNGHRVLRASAEVTVGDILTIPLQNSVRLVEVQHLPSRRGPASEAADCYRMLDQNGETALAAKSTASAKGKSPP
uniref:RNA-binding S4 domain-containing protein n=1 Tax=Parerythrobacter lutipelagi TaxID=1964208 RepID=UPI0010F6016A|nr:S4 domain-containing protein [Parerythrobacter lutipelagi]